MLLGLLLMEINITEIKGAEKVFYQGGGRKRLPKFKFSANFPIGLHVLLQIEIKKNTKIKNVLYLMWKNISTENPLRFNLEPLLK